MNLYTLFKADAKAEKEGIWLEYGSTVDEKPVRIRIARAGGANVQYAKRLEALVKPHRRQIQTETIDTELVQKLLKQVYAETVVLAWENVTDEHGQPLPFSAANVIKLFTDLPDLWLDVQEQAQRAALYRADVLAAEAGN
jgi:hypothetical protein